MKEKDLLKALSDIDDQYILEAAPDNLPSRTDKPRRPFFRTAAFRTTASLAAACLIGVIALGTWQGFHKNSAPQMTQEIPSDFEAENAQGVPSDLEAENAQEIPSDLEMEITPEPSQPVLEEMAQEEPSYAAKSESTGSAMPVFEAVDEEETETETETETTTTTDTGSE